MTGCRCVSAPGVILTRCLLCDERLARFAPGNDAIWGDGAWTECPTCPRDSTGRRVFHHRAAHL